MYHYLMYCLRLVKLLHELGIYEDAVGDIEEITEDDYLELGLRGLDHVAPVCEVEELGEDVCCGNHTVRHFSDPAIPEYSRLCRLYEYKHSISPEENPYMQKAGSYFSQCCHYMESDFGAYYDDDIHVKEICIETCPEHPVYEHELIKLVHDLLEFYREEVVVLKNELMRGPMVWLPALPAPQKRAGRAKKPRKAAKKPVKKAS